MEIQYCSRCKTEQELKYFSITKKRGNLSKRVMVAENKYKGKKFLDTASTTTEDAKIYNCNGCRDKRIN